MTDQKSRSKLKDIFDRLSAPGPSSAAQKVEVDDPHNEGAFRLTSKTQSEFEVLASYDFTAHLKMGLFVQVFYSPYDDEVMELYLGEQY